jgi:putative (di)nucleoside polyphosphate hydrolase
MNNPNDYRPCVGIMLLNNAGKVFVAQRIDTRTEAWQMPQGGIEEGEDLKRAAMRELEEEIGTNKASLMAESTQWLYYDLPIDLRQKLWNGQYKGQRQKWFLYRFLGEDRDINLDTEHPEFLAWRWANINELADLAIPFKRHIYENILQEFHRFLA